MAESSTIPVGTIDAVHGPIVDICTRFLPPLNHALTTLADQGDPVLLEVHQHLDQHRVRTIALHSTAGLARGLPVFDSGAPLHVPVGPACLGRMLNMFGEPLDLMPPFEPQSYRNILAPPALKDTVPAREILWLAIYTLVVVVLILFRNPLLEYMLR